jgi:hypothetical protein
MSTQQMQRTLTTGVGERQAIIIEVNPMLFEHAIDDAHHACRRLAHDAPQSRDGGDMVFEFERCDEFERVVLLFAIPTTAALHRPDRQHQPDGNEQTTYGKGRHGRLSVCLKVHRDCIHQ